MTGIELVAVRHGRTAWNQTGRFQGHTDVRLDAVGRAQAAALATRLASEQYDVIASSDLLRARETAETIARGRGVRVWADSRWRELFFGGWEGLTWAQIVAKFPDLDAPPNAGSGFRHAADGEAFENLCTRIGAAIADIRRGVRDGGRVLVATHAGPLHALLHLSLGKEQAEALKIRFVPASVSRFMLDDDGARILTLNQAVAVQRGA